MERRHNKRVVILRVVTPCSFWVKYLIKHDLEHAVNLHYTQHHVAGVQLQDLKKGMNVVVYVKKISLWCRACVLGYDKHSFEKLVIVRLIDRGRKESVSIEQIKISLELFTRADPLAFQLFLPGLRPLTLQMLPDATFEVRESIEWDPSATIFVQNLISKYKTSFERLARNGRDVLGKLLFETPDGTLNFNENLVKEKYAVFHEKDFEIDVSNFQNGVPIFSQSNLAKERVCRSIPQVTLAEKIAAWHSTSSNNTEVKPESNERAPIPRKIIIPNVYNSPVNKIKATSAISQPNSDPRPVEAQQPNYYPAGMLLSSRISGSVLTAPINQTVQNNRNRSDANNLCTTGVSDNQACAVVPLATSASTVSDIGVPKLRCHLKENGEPCKESVTRRPTYFSHSLPEQEEEDEFEFVLEYRKSFGKSKANMATKQSSNESHKCHPAQKSGIREEFHQGHPNQNKLDSEINSSISRSYCSDEPPALSPLPVMPVANVQTVNRNVMRGVRETPLTKPLGYGRGHLLPPKPAGVVCEVQAAAVNVFQAPAAEQRIAIGRGSMLKSPSSSQLESSNRANFSSFVNAGASCTKTVGDKHSLKLQKNPYHHSECPPGSDDTLLPRGIVDRMTSAKILMCGESPRPDPYKSLASLGCTLLIQNLKKLDVFWPNTLQSHVWPAINAKGNIAAICSKSTGKTIAYLAPLLADLMEKKISSHEVAASSPVILVLASSWRQALKIHMQCNVLLAGCSSCRAAVVYGGGSEETQKTAVVNGCDILVSTPPALVRLMESTKSAAVFTLSSLQCFVFDDVNVLMMYYMAEIRDVFGHFLNSLKSQMNPRSTRRQILAFGTHWNVFFQKFVKNFIPKPTFICSSLCEAAVYSGVTIVTHCVTSPDTLQFFLDMFIPQFQSGLTKVVIFTTEIDDAKAIAYALDECCDVLLAHHEMDLYSIAAISRQWYNGEAVLVTTDTCWAQLDVTDAKHLIHYDIPKLAKGIFANRFSCLLEDMHKFGAYSQFPKDGKSDCKVHLLLTEECKTQAHALYLLLARLVSDVPPMLEEVLVNYYLDREANKRTVPLCESIKALGKCYNKLSCAQRHMIIKSVDKPTLDILSNSLVKVEVTHVKNATHFCGRVIEYVNQSGERIQRASVDAERLNDLKNQLMSGNILSGVNNPKKGDMYAYTTADGNIHRVMVTKIELQMIDAIRIDHGDTIKLKLGDLLQLPDDFKDIPPLIHDIFACKLCPKDKDREWTVNANKYVSDLISDATVTGNLQLALGNTLWIDPIENRVFLSNVKTEVCKWNLRKELLGKYADENDAHIQDIIKLCKNVTNDDITHNNETNSIVGEKIEVAPELRMQNQWAYLGDGKVDVIVSAVQTPAKFFVFKTENKNCLDALLKDINHNPSNSYNNVHECTEFKDNGIYMAKCPSDELWHRVQLIEVMEEGDKEEIKVRFVDVGLECTMKKSVLKMLDEAFLWRIPFQSIECSLHDILPYNEDFNCEASAAFWNMTKDEHGHAKILTARVISKCASQITPNANCHYIELYDGNISLGENLCQLGYGKQEINKNVDNIVDSGPKEKVLTNSLLELQKLKSDSSIKENMIDKPIDIMKPITFVPQSVQPHVLWSDTKDQLKITILVPNVKNADVTIDERFITFKALVNNTMNVSHFVTYGKVVPHDKKVVVKSNSVVIVVKKDGVGNWPRLMQDKQKFSWLKFDYDAIVEETSDCELEKDFLKVPEGYNSEMLNNSESDDEDDVVLDTDEENDLFDV